LLGYCTEWYRKKKHFLSNGLQHLHANGTGPLRYGFVLERAAFAARH